MRSFALPNSTPFRKANLSTLEISFLALMLASKLSQKLVQCANVPSNVSNLIQGNFTRWDWELLNELFSEDTELLLDLSPFSWTNSFNLYISDSQSSI